MNKAELVKAVAEKTGISAGNVKPALDAALELIAGTVKSGDKVELHGFGSFKAHTRPAGKSRNPRTGEAIDVPAKTKLAFKPVPSLAIVG